MRLKNTIYLLALRVFLVVVNAQIIIAAVWKSTILPWSRLRIILFKTLVITRCGIRVLWESLFLLYRNSLWSLACFRTSCSQVSHIFAMSGLRLSMATFAFIAHVIKGSPTNSIILPLLISIWMFLVRHIIILAWGQHYNYLIHGVYILRLVGYHIVLKIV